MAALPRENPDLRCEFVSKARHGLYQSRTLRILFYFLAQAGDVNIHSSSEGLRTVRPDFLQQQVAGKRHASVFNKISQELKFAGGERDNLAVTLHGRAPEVYLQKAELVDTSRAH